MRSIVGPRLRAIGLVIAIGVTAAGCSDCCSGDECNDPPLSADAGPGTGASLAFVNLPASIGCFDDRDSGESGEQIDVEVRLTDDEGQGFDTVTFTVGGADVESAFEGSGLATGRVTLSGGAAPGLANTVVAKASNGTETLSVSAQVLDTCVPPEPPPPLCSFVAPTDGAVITAPTGLVEVECSGGNPNDPAQRALLGAGLVLVTVTVDGAEPTTSEVQLSGGTGGGTLIFPNGDGVTATLDLSLVGVDDVLGVPVTDTIEVTLDVDTVPPAAPALTLDVISVRGGAITVSFTEPGDDNAAGALTSLEVVASPDPIAESDVDVLAAQAFSFTAGGLVTDVIEGAGAARVVALDPVLFERTWRVAVRVTDDKGLRSFAVAEAGLLTTETVLGSLAAVRGTAVGTGDLDGDGDDDVVVTTADGSALLVPGVGSIPAPADTARFGASAALVDLDGDGRTDLVASAASADLTETLIHVYYGADGALPTTPDAVLRNPFDVTSDNTQDADLVLPVGDVDADGCDDFALLSTQSLTATVLLVRSSVRLVDSLLADVPGLVRLNIGANTAGVTTFLPTAVGLGDVDGDVDGAGDLALATDSAEGVTLWIVAGSSSWPPSVDVVATASSVLCGPTCSNTSLSAGDVNGDGATDLVVPHVDRLDVFAGPLGAGVSSRAFSFLSPDLSVPPPGKGRAGVVGDVNGDGIDDVLVHRNGAPPGASLFLGRAGVGDREPDLSYVITAPEVIPVSCGDVDGAGDDLAEICWLEPADGALTTRR